eukprot:XP_015152943.1 intraflagellar transport protein 57 homolog isoform X2 [Gallus gallus]
MQGMYSLNESHNFLPGAAPPLPQTLQQPHLTRTLPRCPARANWYHHPLGLPVNPCSADEHATADHSFPRLYSCKAAAIPALLGGRAERLRALHAIDGTEEEEAVGDWQNRLLRQRAVAWGSKMAERDDDGPVAERGPGAAYAAFVLMEELLDKLKLLSYEEEALRRHNVRPLSRHYFALPTNPGEQFFVFCTLAAWLITKAGHHFEQPQEYDDPNAIISKILSELRSFEEESDNEENFIDLNVLKAQTYRSDVKDTTKQEEILQSTTDAAEWNLEVERVLPQLKVTVRTDNKDWRIHVDQMHQHKDGIESSLKETRGYLDKFHNEISRTLEKINSREKYINNQLEHLIQEYRSAQALLSEAKEKYQEGSGGVTERIRVLSEITEVLEKVKQETEEKGSSMTDGTPLVRIKQALTKLKQETIQMDIQIGVMEHTLLQSKLKEKSNMTRDMNAAMIPESTIGAY